MKSTSANREYVISRLVDAPRELIFRAWTELEQLSKWWGPRGFTTTTKRYELAPGGVWRFVMHGPDGTEQDHELNILEVEGPERLVYTQSADETGFGFSHSTVSFEVEGPKTRVTMRVVLNTVAEYEQVKAHAIPGGNAAFDRLEEHLASLSLMSEL
jgi:uncharacterized protein YndB with AHSA1/START domain